MQLIGHRGGSGLRVENTLAAFAHAIELGAPGAELDVHLSADGALVVHHDEHLNSGYCRHLNAGWITPGERLSLAQMTLQEMREYDIGAPRPDSAYAKRFPRLVPTPGERIPLLSEVIALAKARSEHFFLVVEIKTPLLDADENHWRPLVDATLAVVAEQAFFPRVILCSFHWGALRYAMRRRPGLRTWFTSNPLSYYAEGEPPAVDIPPGAQELARLREAWHSGAAAWFDGFDPVHFGGDRVRAVAAAGGSAWFPYYRDFSAETAARAAAHGLETAVWSVNLRDAAALARLAASGVHYHVTDYPDGAPPA